MSPLRAKELNALAATALRFRAAGIVTVRVPLPPRKGGPFKHFTDDERAGLKILRSRLWRDKQNGRDGLRYQVRIDAILRAETLRANNGTNPASP